MEDIQDLTTRTSQPENSSNTDEHGKVVQNYFVVKCKVGNKEVKALIDTGAQPTVLKKSLVPLGTIIKRDNTSSIKGVQGPTIKTYGTAKIMLELGYAIIPINCIIVYDNSIDFPAETGIILGANTIALNGLNISSEQWCIYRNKCILQPLEPAVVDGKFFASPQLVYDTPDLQVEQNREIEWNSQAPGNHLGCNPNEDKEAEATIGPVNGDTTTFIQNPKKFYPRESSVHDPSEESLCNESFESSQLEPAKISNGVSYTTQTKRYSVMTSAPRSLKSNHMCLISIAITDELGNIAAEKQMEADEKGIATLIDQCYHLKGGTIAPGIIMLDGISRCKDSVYVINLNDDDYLLSKDVHLTSASRLDEEDIAVQDQGENSIDLKNDNVIQLMTLSAITETAYVTPEEYAQDLDELQEALEYDPYEIPSTPVIYDRNRFQRLLQALQSDTWNLSKKQRASAEKVLWNNQRAFNLVGEPLPMTHLIKHDIVLRDEEEVVFVKPRWTPMKQRGPIENEISGLLKHNLAGPTTSGFSSPVVLVRKKDKDKWRLAVDFREVNKKTVPMWHPVTNLEEVIHKVGLSKVHSSIDLRNGYLQIGLFKRAQPKTAFSSHLGHHQYYRMPFGLCNAPHTLNKLMLQVFGTMNKYVSTFFDDVFIHSDSTESHMEHLDKALSALIAANLQVGAEKSKLFTKEVEVLGHIAGNGVIKPGLDKLQGVRDFPVPKTKTNIRSFLGLTGFYRKFVKNYAYIAKPLTELTRDDAPFIWTEAHQNAFESLKKVLMTDPVLKAPDFNRKWYLITDACDIGVAAWLGQKYHGKIHAVAYFSRQLRKSEVAIRRDAMELECLAILEGLKKYRPLIWGQCITILTDNNALMWLFNKSIYKSARLTRWALSIQSYNVQMLHLPGTANRVADAMSRNPAPIELEEDWEEKAVKILDGCDQANISLIGIFSNQKHPSQREVVLRINAIREKEQDEQEYQQSWTIEELLKAQRSDSLLKPIIEYIQHPNVMNRMKIDPNIKNIEDYFIDASKCLFLRKNDEKAVLREEEEVLVIPFALQRRAISVIHDTVLGGHMAAERTLFAAERRFFWRSMKDGISKYIRNCKVCQLNKGVAHAKQPLRKYPLPDKPFDVISTDLIGPLKLTTGGNRYILVCTDFLTRYCVVEPLQNKSADKVCEGLWKIWCEHGCPSILYSDSGSEFRNAVLKEMTAKFQVQHHHVAVYHPASNGLCERKNSSILAALKCFMEWEEWDKVLPTAQLAVNAAYSSPIGDSPFFVYRGKDPELPETRFAKPQFSYNENLSFEKLRQRREHIVMEVVKQKLLEAADANGRSRQKHCKEKTLAIDDRVFCRRIQKKNESKLIPKWQGPYRILAQKNPGVYKLKNILTGKISECHIENIKNQTIMARESEIPLSECPAARLPYPEEEEEEVGKKVKRVPEGAEDDIYEDESFLLCDNKESD